MPKLEPIEAVAPTAEPVVEQAPQPEAPAAEPAAEPIVYLTLVSSEEKIVEISELAAKQSVLLENMIANQVIGEPIPFVNTDEETLKRIVTWCEQHKGEAAPVEDESVPKKVEIPQWDEDFLNIDNTALFNLIVAANYFDIKQLMSYACKKVANMAKGKSPEELRVIFCIPTDEEDEAAERALQVAAQDKAEQAEKAKKANP